MSESFDVGELFTLSARPVIAQALARGLSFHYDIWTHTSQILGSTSALQRSFHRFLCAGLDLLKSGNFGVEATTEYAPSGDIVLRVALVLSGRLVTSEQRSEVWRRLNVEELAGSTQFTGEATCPLSGARLVFRTEADHAASLQVALHLVGKLDEEPLLSAHGEEALVLHSTPGAAEGLARRLRRYGWSVTTANEAKHLADDTTFVQPADYRLIIVSESAGLGQPMASSIARAYPTARVIFAVPAGSMALASEPSGETVQVVPMLPSELWDLTSPFATEAELHSRPMSLANSPRPKVLIVDDNEVNLLIAEGLLRILDYNPVVARSGQEALDICAHTPPALVLMDINMPGMDGLEATRRLKAAQRSGDMALFNVVALTASNAMDEAAAVGMDAYLAKPLLLADLKAALIQATVGRGHFPDPALVDATRGPATAS